MRRIMDLIGRLFHRPMPVDRQALRDQMTRDDPEFARVRDVHHEALSALTAKRAADDMAKRAAGGTAIRHERQFWERHGGQSK